MTRIRWFQLVAVLLLAGSTALSAQETLRLVSRRTDGRELHAQLLPPTRRELGTVSSRRGRPTGRAWSLSMHGSIWTVDIDSGLAVELVSGPKYYSSPSYYAPDGRWLIYTADDHGHGPSVWRSSTSRTGDTHRAHGRRGDLRRPVVQPGRKSRMVYVSTRADGLLQRLRPGLRRTAAWAGEATVAVTADNSFGKDRLYFGSEDIHINPTWFPDGEELLLVSNRDVALGSGNVFRVPARAGGFEDRVQVLAEQTLYRTQPHVSIDGKRFVFSSTRGTADQFNNLYVQPTVGGEPYKMTFFEHDAFHPRWSPDGEWIAFIDNDGRERTADACDCSRRTAAGSWTSRSRVAAGSNPMGRLSMTTLGPDGAPTGTRVHVIASDGKSYAPADQYAPHRRSGPESGPSTTRGSFEVELPVGRSPLVVVKGFEHVPVGAKR